MMHFRALTLVALVCLSTGCLANREYRHIYALDGAVQASTPDGAAVAERPVMQLERVLIPDYLDTTGILLRVGEHEIHENTTGRFGERLSLGVTHALRADLALQLPQYTIALTQSAGWPVRQILVNVDAFDVASSGRCVLVAEWSIVGADRRTFIIRGSRHLHDHRRRHQSG
jgi:uncharacterized lipoprotein YmbA